MIADILDNMLKNWITNNFLWGAYIIFGLDLISFTVITTSTIFDSPVWFPFFLTYTLYCLVKIVDAHRKHIKKDSNEDWKPPVWARYAAYVSFTGFGLIMLGFAGLFLFVGDLRDELIAWVAIPGGVIGALMCVSKINELRHGDWVSGLIN